MSLNFFVPVFFLVGEAAANHHSESCPVNMTAPVDIEAKATKKGCFDLMGMFIHQSLQDLLLMRVDPYIALCNFFPI